MLKNKKQKILLLSFAFIVILFFWSFRQNLTTRHYVQKSSKISSSIRIAVISDLHSVYYGKDQSELLSVIDSQSPDILFLTGDIFEDQNPHDGSIQFLEGIAGKYPCYYVTGNHEFWSDEVDEIKEKVRSYNIPILEGGTEIVDTRGQFISISGVDDPEISYYTWKNQLNTSDKMKNNDLYTILLSHRPEKVADYSECSFDLIVSGHAHGGQVRIPGILNGLFAPNQGLFPKYAGGEYEFENFHMIVSRGLAKNNIPRIWNPPELVIVDVKPITGQ